MKIFLEPLVIVVTIAASVAAAPSRKIMGPLDESNMAYPLGSYNDPFDASEISNYRPRQDNNLMRYQRTGLDSLSGATFGQSKKYDPSTRLTKTGPMLYNPGKNIHVLSGLLPKRNFDEIDRTNFDSFVKKNGFKVPRQATSGGDFDEIDHGFGGVILNNY